VPWINDYRFKVSGFLVVEGAIIINSQPDPVVEADYLMILGAGLN